MTRTVASLTSGAYVYVMPLVECAREKVPLVDGVAQRIEACAPPAVEVADKCVDALSAAAQWPVTMLKDTASAVEDKANGLVATSEALADRLLPPAGTSTTPESNSDGKSSMVRRAAALVFGLPMRIVVAGTAKTRGLGETLGAASKQGADVVCQEAAKLWEHASNNAHWLSGKVASIPGADRLRACLTVTLEKLQAGNQLLTRARQVALVKACAAYERLGLWLHARKLQVQDVLEVGLKRLREVRKELHAKSSAAYAASCERLRTQELKAWLFERTARLQRGAVLVASSASCCGSSLAERVLGEQRAATTLARFTRVLAHTKAEVGTKAGEEAMMSPGTVEKKEK